MEEIDTVQAHCLNEHDVIRTDIGLSEILSVDDTVDKILVTCENDEELELDPFEWVAIHGYTEPEEEF